MGDHFVGGSYFFVKPWAQVKTMESSEPNVMPVWVAFLEFPSEFWGKEAFCMIRSKLGKPIRMDGGYYKGRGV